MIGPEIISPAAIRSPRGAIAAVLVWGLLPGLFGCGHQDRLDPVNPPPPSPMQFTSWGTLVDILPPVFWGYRPTGLAGWSRDDILLGMGDGVILRKTGDFYRRQDLPLEKYVVNLQCNPDGTAWCLDSEGGVWLLDGGQWQLEQDLPEGEGYEGLQADGLDRLWVYGRQGMLWRRTGEEWFQYELPDTLNIDDAWLEPDGSPVLVTEQLDVIRVQGDSWEVTTLTWPAPGSQRKIIEGDGAGRLAIAEAGASFFWLYEDSVWTEVEDVLLERPRLTDVFWLDDDLYGVLYENTAVARWDGEQWVDEQDFPGVVGYQEAISSPVGSGRVIGMGSGLALGFYPGPPQVLAEKVANIQCVALAGDTPLIGFYSGETMRKEASGWRLEPRALPLEESLRGIIPDRDGGFVLLGSHSIVRVPASGPPETLAELQYPDFYPQDDGTVLVGHEEELYELVDGRLNYLMPFSYRSDPTSMKRDRQGRVVVLDSWRVSFVENGTASTWWTLAGWEPRGLIVDPLRGVGVYGHDRALIESAAGFADVSPWTTGVVTWKPLGLDDVCVDGQGGWLATIPSGDRILRYDGEEWFWLDHTFPGVADVSDRGIQIQPAGDGSFLLFSRSLLMRLVPEGGLP